jgi:molybdopterin/thiamine biosynthesis adenylyltransferase
MIEERYVKTVGTLTPDEVTLVRTKRVCIIGCGGLGGYILEMLARAGIMHITVVDGDVFSKSNLNRQLLCTEENIGEYKADHAVRRIEKINSEVHIRAHNVYLGEENAEEILRNHDVAIDALDNVPSRLLLEKYAEKLNMPLVHGAIHNWLSQIAVVMPGDRTLTRLYGTSQGQPPAVPPFTPPLCAALQVSQTIKLLCGRETLARGQLLVFDLYDNSVNVFTI